MNTLSGFFDYASATPLAGKVLESMNPFFNEQFFNPSALYSAAEVPKSALKDARERVASELGVTSREILFTSGCTEANNLAVIGVMNANPGGKVLVSTIEHESVLKPAGAYVHAYIPVDNSGVVDLPQLEKLIDDSVVLISVMYVNNEIGTVQPLKKIADIVAKIRKHRGKSGKPLYLHTDAAQAPNTMTISRNALGVDLMSINGGKIYGPKGSGCLFVGGTVKIEPVLFGGGQEFGLRSGTENIPSIVGFSRALSLSAESRQTEYDRQAMLQSIFEQQVVLLGGEINAKQAYRVPSISSVMFRGYDNETLLYKLSNMGFSVASGSACHAKSGDKSHVLTAIGLSDKHSMSTIRISFGKTTSEEGILKLLEAIKLIVA